jgi:hypothetical protein
LTYDFPPAVKTKVNRLWGGEWHGQAQKWCVFFFHLVKHIMKEKKTSVSLTSDDMHLAPDEFQGLVL